MARPELLHWFLPQRHRKRGGRWGCRCGGQTHLLQHERLLLLEQGLQLGRRQDLLHLLRGEHLR